MYKAQQESAAQSDASADGAGNAPKPDDNVVDAEFSEVDDDKKKGAA
jgi:molecular chaperone DnaK